MDKSGLAIMMVAAALLNGEASVAASPQPRAQAGDSPNAVKAFPRIPSGWIVPVSCS
jgi:hypothetical protein